MMMVVDRQVEVAGNTVEVCVEYTPVEA